MSRHRWASLSLAAALVAAGCAVDVGPTAERPSGSGTFEPTASPAEETWRISVVRAPDVSGFRAEAGRSGLIAGDRTIWVKAVDGTWMPGDALDQVEDVGRLGVTTWRGGFVSWAIGGLVQTSADGVAWHDASAGPGEANLASIVPFGDELILVGQGMSDPAGAWRSRDGSIWTPIKAAPDGMLAATTRPGGDLLAIGASGPDAAAWLTADAVEWERAADPRPEAAGLIAWHGVAANPAGVVVIGNVGEAPAVWWSLDGTAWTRSQSFFEDDAYLSHVSAVPGGFAIAGRRRDRPVVWLSSDGRSWSAVDLPIEAGTQGQAEVVRTTDGGLVAFGYSMQDEGNGGSSRSGYLVWTLGPG